MIHRRFSALVLLGLVTLGASPSGLSTAQDAPPASKSRLIESAELTDGSRVEGRLAAHSSGRVTFIAASNATPISWERIRNIQMDGPGLPGSLGIPPFQIGLGLGNRVSGKFLGLSGDQVLIDPGQGRSPWQVKRGGVTAIVQRPGEVQVLRESFETLDTKRWSQTGVVELTSEERFAGEKAMALPAGTSSITTRIAEPFASGRLDMAYWDPETRAPGQRWFVDLTFRKGTSDLSTMRIVPGWSEEILAVETPGGPPLTVQPLIRKKGWHRLVVQFDAERVAVTLDGNDLSHGRGVGGPLIEVRIATETVGAAQPPDGLKTVVDDLRVIRLVEPTGRFEVDPSQDEIRLVSGDQLFGKLGVCDAEWVRLTLDGRELRLGWNEVAGFYPRRVATASEPMSGLWVDVEWRTVSGRDPRDVDRVEAVFSGIDETNLLLDAPYVGRVAIPRAGVQQITVQSRSERILLDVHSHHLGDRMTAELDPPQAEPQPVEIPFTLGKVPTGDPSLLLDVLKVIGEEGNREFSSLVKKGELRTAVYLNGKKLDDLNRFVSTSNETPLRLRMPIPPGLLKEGENRLKFEQNGTLTDPLLRDNLGLLRIAVDFASESPVKP